jgi:hypothetical protein
MSTPQHAAAPGSPRVPAFLVPLLPYAKSLVAAVLGAVVAVVVPLLSGGNLGLHTVALAIGSAAITGAGTWWVKNRDAVERVVFGEFNQPGVTTTAADPVPPVVAPPAPPAA